MKCGILLILTALLFTGCKDAIEDIKRNAILDAMTSGKWKVTTFTKGSTDETAAFSPYLFQFYENRTVDALKNSAVEKKGIWQEDETNLTIQATFSNAAEPLILLNGTWKITNTTWTYVKATQTVNGEQWFLRLDKE